MRHRLDSRLSSLVVNGSTLNGSTCGAASAEGEGAGRELAGAKAGLMPQGCLEPQAVATSISSDLAHDAGYDSLMTSMVFLMQIGHVLHQKGLSWEDLHFR